MNVEECLKKQFLYHGVSSASHLAAVLAVSQPTFSRKLSEWKKEIVKIGSGLISEGFRKIALKQSERKRAYRQ